MKTNLVIDSSVAFKWFSKTEPGRGIALQLLRKHKSKKITLLVPDLIIYELANAWATKSSLLLEDIETNLRFLAETDLKMVVIDFKILRQAVVLSKEHKVSVYDAIFAALAMVKNCDLITADNKFVEKVKLAFIKRLSEIKN